MGISRAALATANLKYGADRHSTAAGYASTMAQPTNTDTHTDGDARRRGAVRADVYRRDSTVVEAGGAAQTHDNGACTVQERCLRRDGRERRRRRRH